MQYTGYSLTQDASLEAIIAGLTGATGTEGKIISNHADFTTKNTTYTTRNTTQDGTLSSLETKATNLENGATGLENRNNNLNTDYLSIQSRESALIVGLTGTAGSTGLEARSVGFSNKIVAINNQLNGEIQDAINTKVADSIFDTLTNEFNADFQNFQDRLNQKVVTVTQNTLDSRQDSDDAVLEKKFCTVEEFAQTFQQTYTVVKTDNSPYIFDGKIQKVDKAPPIFSIVEKAQSTSVPSAWDFKIKLTDYGYNVMSGNLVIKNGAGLVVNTLVKANFDATTKTYILSLMNSNSSGSLINGPYTFEYRTSTSTSVYSLALNGTVLESISLAPPVFGTSWTQLGQDIDGQFNSDQNGYSVSLSNDGNIIAIGIPYYSSSDIGIVRVYQYNGTSSWVQIGQDINGQASGDYNGFSVSLNANGNILVIGLPGNDGNGSNSGRVRVYQYNGTSSWVQIGQDINGQTAGDQNGFSVSVNNDGTIIAIGDASYNGKGSVRVYQYNGTSTWNKLGQDIDGQTEGDMNGYSVSLSADGSIVGIGAPYNDSAGTNSGRVRVYQYNGTSSWVQIGQDINGKVGSQSGWSVSLSEDGSIVGIGAPYKSFGALDNGYVRVYQYNGTSSWVQIGQDINGIGTGDNNGYSVSLNADGTIIASGARYNDGNGSNAGRVSVYRYNGTSTWNKLGQDIDGQSTGDMNGYSVSLSADGIIIATGAPYNDGPNTDTGRVRIYKLV